MKLPRRGFLRLAACAAALPALSLTARAQAYPSRPVRLIVGYAPAGGTDITARLIGQWLSERLGQQFVIENRPGANSNIATEAVVRASPDGYTLLLSTAANAVNATLYEKLNFNFMADIAPVAGIMRVPNVMVVNPSFPAKTVPEFIAYAKANPGKINLASGGAGGVDHMAGELLKMMTGIHMTHVPYRGLGPALTDLLGGQVQLMFSSFPAAIEYIKSDRLRVIAVTTAMRFEGAPDIPTMGEVLPGFEAADMRAAIDLCREGPNKRHQFAYSITSSARAHSVGGMSRPIAFAVMRFTARSNLVGCSTGMSAGLVPRKILSTISAERR